jgi:hypothetical protein
MEDKKIFTLQEHLDAIEAAYSIGAVESVTKKDKYKLIASLQKAVIKYAKVKTLKIED